MIIVVRCKPIDLSKLFNALNRKRVNVKKLPCDISKWTLNAAYDV